MGFQRHHQVLQEELGDRADVRIPHGSATRLAAEVEHAGVHLVPGPVFTVEGGSDAWLRIPFTQPEARLAEAVGRIARAWSGMGAGAHREDPARVLIA